MEKVRLSAPILQSDESGVSIACDISISGTVRNLSFWVSPGPVTEAANPFVTAVLLPAMKMNMALSVEGRVDEDLLIGFEAVQRTFAIWRKEVFVKGRQGEVFRRVPIAVDNLEPSGSEAADRGVAAFFSGGVDSFFTLLEHREEISHLIYVHDFDIDYPPERGVELARNVREVAQQMDLKLVEVVTNARVLFKREISWVHYHGSVLASIALLLQPRFRRVYIPSSHDVAQLFPWGSHPLVDPNFSTLACQIIHDRVDVTRLEKTAAIAKSKIALAHLRVCWKPDFNCGYCNKCTRTLLALQALGMSSEATSFSRPRLTPKEVGRIDLRQRQTAKYFEEIADFLVDRDEEPDLVAAIESAIGLEYYRGAGHLFRRIGSRLRRFVGKLLQVVSRGRV